MIKIFFNLKNEIKIHYLFIESIFLTTRHEQHYEMHYKFRP
jgi:hypothetical protein